VRRLGLVAGLVLLLAALIFTGLYLSQRATVPAPASAKVATAPRPAEVQQTPDAQAASSDSDVGDNVVQVGIKALLGGGRVDESVEALLMRGDVAAARKRLEELSDASGLYRLGIACSAAVRPDSEALAETADRQQVLAAANPEIAVAFAPLIVARAEFRRRLAAGCRAAPEDHERIMTLLAARAAQGDGDSQYLLALTLHPGDEQTRKLQSAALLGSAPAALTLALPALTGSAPVGSPARSAAAVWLKGAAANSPEAALDSALCQAQGCAGGAGGAEREAAKANLELLARQGDLAAIGVLAASAGFSLPPALDIDPIAAPDSAPIEPQAAQRYAWVAFGARLARDGCALASGELIGTLPVSAVQAEAALAASLTPADLEAGHAAADALWNEAGASAEAAQGCR
jgi:hypothetical protein